MTNNDQFQGGPTAGTARVSASWCLAIFLFALLFLTAGCQTKVFTDPILGPDYAATNVYRKQAVLPQSFRRVAVLPISYSRADAATGGGVQMLEPVLRTELGKTTRFELSFIQPKELRLWTGREEWDDIEALPEDLLKVIAERTGADGVLFVRLTQFKAYPPIVIGWRMKLVTNAGDNLWTVDETFDAAEERVSNSARRYDRGRSRSNPALNDSRSILLSPSAFGRYTLSTCFSTLPGR